MNILVTGGAGYIGSHTIIELLNGPINNVISIDNHINSSPEIYQRIKKITNREVKSYNIDLNDIDECKRVFEENQIDGVIHFAALKSAPESVKMPILYFQNNLKTLLNLLECLIHFNVNNFIFSSSCSVYGDAIQLPVDENSPLQRAESPYGSSKKIGEEIIEDIVKANKQFKSVILRYFNPVGAHVSGLIGEVSNSPANNLFPLITQTAIGYRKELEVFGSDYDTPDGTCIRDYVHVSDIANAHVLALKFIMSKNPDSSCEIFNLGSGKGNSVLEVIKAFETRTDKKLNYKLVNRRKGDIVSIYADNQKAKGKLGWEIMYDLNDMIDSAWEWQKKLQIESNF